MSTKPLRIALDFDDTYTAAPQEFGELVQSLLRAEHEVAFVTARFDDGFNADIVAASRDLGIPVVYCGGRQKAHCYRANIWIDDMPEMIPSLDAMRGMMLGCARMGDSMPSEVSGE